MDTSSTSFYAQPAQKFQPTRHISCEGTGSAVAKLGQEAKLQQRHERDTQTFGQNNLRDARGLPNAAQVI
jgi:hypothetical protein